MATSVKAMQMHVTADGSRTLFDPITNEPFHSVRGAATESRHVFIDVGFKVVEATHVRVLEVGLGTGLNLLLTLDEAQRTGRSVHYVAVEPHRLAPEVLIGLDHCGVLGLEALRPAYEQCMGHASAQLELPAAFTFTTVPDFTSIPSGAFDVVYFDAFAPAVEPGLWTEGVFARMFQLMGPGGILVTYCAKGEVRRTMQRCGFDVDRLSGPPGKHEMLRARRPL